MATRSRIGIELTDGSILSAYHHWDGYPMWLGNKLREHYNTRSAVAELIDGGDMSSCYTNCGFSNDTLPETGPLYYSARGEECPARYDASLVNYLNNNPEEYAYVFNRMGEWVCYKIDWNTEKAMLVEISEPVAA